MDTGLLFLRKSAKTKGQSPFHRGVHRTDRATFGTKDTGREQQESTTALRLGQESEREGEAVEC